MTKVTICIPQFNHCEELRLVIKDILNQTYRDFELIICDDVSIDNTFDVISEFDDSRIQYVRNNEHLGLFGNFNRCVELATGDYIAIYHNHDRYAHNIVEKSVKLLDENPSIGYVHTGTVWKKPGDHFGHIKVQNWPIISDGRWFTQYLISRWDSPVHQPTVMARRKMFDVVGLFNERIYAACADSAIWIKMSTVADVGYIPLPLMQVTPRVSTDRYGKFSWADIVGMAKAHELGVHLLNNSESSEIFSQQITKMRRNNDRYFLLYFSRCIAKGRYNLVNEGLDAIKDQCTLSAYQLARFLSSSSRLIRLPLWLISKLYGVIIRVYYKFISLKGWVITRNNSKKM